jgi:hypothetical protein
MTAAFVRRYAKLAVARLTSMSDDFEHWECAALLKELALLHLALDKVRDSRARRRAWMEQQRRKQDRRLTRLEREVDMLALSNPSARQREGAVRGLLGPGSDDHHEPRRT